MAPKLCENKSCTAKASLIRPKNSTRLCIPCFYLVFETEIHNTITTNNLFNPGQHIAIAASGGKDSTVLAHVMNVLNKRYNYGLKLSLLSVDEGIIGYRDDSLATVSRNEIEYNIPLTIVSYKSLYGWSMDEIVAKIGTKNNCTFCGVFRRQALDRGAALINVDGIVTGHNADDIAETVLMNIMRGDLPRLRRCTCIVTGNNDGIPRSKPFKYTYEKEIVMYAYFKKLDYFSTECTYSPNAFRGHARTFLKDLERINPRTILDIIASGEAFETIKGSSNNDGSVSTVPIVCERCGYMSSGLLCKACMLLEGLNKGVAKVTLGEKEENARLKPGNIALHF